MQRDELDDLKNQALKQLIRQQLAPQQVPPSTPDPPKLLHNVQGVVAIIVGIVTLVTSIVIVTNYVSSIRGDLSKNMEVSISNIRSETIEKISDQKDSTTDMRIELEKMLRASQERLGTMLGNIEDLEEEVGDLEEQVRVLKSAHDSLYREVTFLKSQNRRD